MFTTHNKKENKITYEKFEESNEIEFEDMEIDIYKFENTYGIPGYRINGKLNILGNKKDLTAFYLPLPYTDMEKIGYKFIDYVLTSKYDKECKIPEKTLQLNGNLDYDPKVLKGCINIFSVMCGDDLTNWEVDNYESIAYYIPLLLYYKGLLKNYNTQPLPFLNNIIYSNLNHAIFLMAKPLIFINKSKSFLKDIEDGILKYYKNIENEHEYSTLDYINIICEYISNNSKFKDIEIINNHNIFKNKFNGCNILRNKIMRNYTSNRDFLTFNINHISDLEIIFKLMYNEQRIDNIKEDFINIVKNIINNHNAKEQIERNTK